MIVLAFLKNIVIAFLIGYLALTNALAERIEILLSTDDGEPAEMQEVYDDTEIEPEAEGGPITLQKLSDEYEYGGPIPDILLRNAGSQEASLIGSSSSPKELRPQTSTTSLSAEERLRESLVNIYCQYRTGSHVRTTVGTGFFISNTGVILTNAHVAQFLLLENAEDVESAQCIIRGGNPAEPLYEAELLYIPPTWITKNASLIRDDAPKGTGEGDFALLYVSGPLPSVILPSAFPFVTHDVSYLPHRTKGTTVMLGGYPAEQIYADGPSAVVPSVVATTTITELFTFGSMYADVFSIASSTVGEHGASGGPVLDANGNAIGLIVTKGDEETEGKHSLRAITLSYIDRTITEQTEFSLKDNLLGDLPYRARIFRESLIPVLSKILGSEIK